MKVWIVVVTWVWWIAMFGPPCVCPLMAEEQDTLLRYTTVKFTTESATANSYTQFIELVRDQLRSGFSTHGIPLLRDPSTVPDSQRFLLVELSNSAELSITLAIDVTNANVVAYQAGDRSYFFGDAPRAAYCNLFLGTMSRTLFYESSYPALERVANEHREDIHLGIGALDAVISSLGGSGQILESAQARSFIVLIQMVSEAARFRDIEQRVRDSITSKKGFRPDGAILSLENSWGDLSKRIQESNKGGVFSRPVQLQRSDSSPYQVDNVRSIIPNIVLMVLVCRDRVDRPIFSDDDQFIIRSVVAADGIYGTDTCVEPEPTVRISGRDGLCVDVRDGQYDDGNPIQLWRCGENLDTNQLWTLKKDGTIQSNGKCLTTNGFSAGSNVMIYNCTTAAPAAIRWQVWDNGTIWNPQSARALSAESGKGGTILTVEGSIYASRQGWLPGNNTTPFVTSIIGFNDLCMQANRSSVWVAECASNKTEQKWAIYGDGSIRPQQNRDRCLTSNNHFQGTNIIILSCNPGWNSQRWVFKNDGTIFNLHNGMVMDVKGSDLSLLQIILYPVTGKPNQKWLPLL